MMQATECAKPSSESRYSAAPAARRHAFSMARLVATVLRPAPPFTTSTLTQEASRKLGFSTSRTMRIAQRLKDGVELADGTIDAIASATMAGGTGTCMGRKVYTRAEGGNADLEFEAIDFGPDAKTITMSYVHSAGMTTLPTVAVTEGATTVAIVVTATIGTHTALNILQALRNSDAAMEWIHARLADGSSGAGTPIAFAATALTAPFGTDGFTARIGTLIANVQSLTDAGGTFDCAAGVGTAGDTVEFVVRIGGIEHTCSAAVVA